MSTSSSPSLSSTMTTDEVCYNWLYFFTNVINVTIFWMTKLQSDSNKLTMLLCVLVVVYSLSCTRCRVLVVVYSSSCTRCRVLVVVYSSSCTRHCVLVVVYLSLCTVVVYFCVVIWMTFGFYVDDKVTNETWMNECHGNVIQMLPVCYPIVTRWHIATINEIMS